MDIKNKVETLLFSSPVPLSLGDISELLETPKEETSKILRSLIREYEKRQGAIEIAKLGKKYRIQLRHEYSELADMVAERELNRDQLRVLGFIVARNRTNRTDLRERFGSRYEFITDTLVDKKFITVKRDGNADIFTVTKKFFTYFNVDKKKLEELRLNNGEGLNNGN
ncbi:SMC-Scp complex subunit ScpB [Oxyplasma meridianum]|uniref:SMC-Scp complex subunit ScpB n=1 Tax=Oxyplasma meridianum TaxID=3073602 RepID=A0AAX4NFG5_9ARCH